MAAMTYYGGAGGYEAWYSHQRHRLPQSCYATQRAYYQRPAWSHYGREYITLSIIRAIKIKTGPHNWPLFTIVYNH